MLRSITLALAATTAVALSTAAFAADLPMAEPAPMMAAPGFSWSGFYVGGQAGYGWGNSSITFVGSLNPKGAILGGYAGYNVQLDNSPLVLGIETDFNWSDQDRKRTDLSPADIRTTKNELNWTGATRGRVGYAFDNFLAYAAGGVAYSRRKISVTGQSLLGPFSFSDTKTAIGWTVGGGVEFAVTENILTRVEYRYSDFGKDTFDGAKSKLTEHRVMGGVAYKFGW